MPSTDQAWIRPTILLCVNGFFSSLNPSEPYLTPYLMGPRKNLTETQLVNQVYPVWIYSYLCFLVPVFLLTDFLKYKPVVIIGGLGHIGCWLLLLFGEGVAVMQVMQVFFGITTAGEIGYYSYIYSIVPESKYQQVTSYTRSVVQFGLFLGAVLAQILVTVANIDYFYLNVIALINITIGFIVSLFLPMPKKTLFFYTKSKSNDSDPDAISLNETNSSKDKNIEEKSSEENETLINHNAKVESENDNGKIETDTNDMDVQTKTWKVVVLTLLKDLKSCYLNLVLLRWSVWWALSTCGFMLVINYVQNLWETIQPSKNNHSRVFNGAVESFATVLGAIGAFAVGHIKLSWSRWGEMALGFCSLFKCGLLLLMYLTTNIWICYAAYVAYIFLYNFVITITQFQLAVGLNTERFALVFGVNTFMAVALNAILTIVIIDEAGLGLDVNTQFIIYSVYFGILALIFLSHGIYSLTQRVHRPSIEVVEIEGDESST